MSKSVKIESQFKILNSAGVTEAKKVTNSTVEITEATQVFPKKIAANSINEQISFGGVDQAKQVFIRTSQPVILKVNQSSDDGFSIGPGDSIFSSQDGITALFISTGVSETEVEIIIAGA